GQRHAAPGGDWRPRRPEPCPYQGRSSPRRLRRRDGRCPMTDAERAERVARELVRVKPEDGFACVYIADEFVAAEPGCETSPLANAFRLAIASALTAALAEARAEWEKEREVTEMSRRGGK